MFFKRLIFILLIVASTINSTYSNIAAVIKTLKSLKDNLVALQEALKSEPKSAEPIALQTMHTSHVFGQPNMRKVFTQDCLNYADENKKIPAKTPKTFRIMTYNVYMGHKAIGGINVDSQKKIISTLDPDILILQEAAEKYYNDLGGYNYKFSGPLFDKYGNMLLWKKALTNVIAQVKLYDALFHENRGYINAIFTIAGKQLSVYGTHIEVWDKTGIIRQKQINELKQSAQDSKVPNILIMGDFNSTRRQDYDDPTWIKANAAYKKHSGNDIDTSALDEFTTSGFEDCFTHANFMKPKFTVWTGTVIDYIFLKKDPWNLPIKGCYVYYSADSDHMPIIMDIDLSKINGTA